MGFSEKHQIVEGGAGGLEFDGKKWVLAGIPLRAPLKPIYTKKSCTHHQVVVVEKDCSESDDHQLSTTPTAEEATIPRRLTCPPAPKKRKPTLKCNFTGGRDFFTPPDLESVFIRHVERAN